MHGWKKAASAAFVAVSVVALGACAATGNDSGSADDPIIIGFATAKTGWMAPYDGPADKSFQMKIDEVNADGGIDGRQIEVITADNQTDPAKAKQVTADLISQGADIIVGSCNYDIGSASGVEAQNNGLLGLTICAASPRWGVQGIGEFAYSGATATFAEGATLAEFAESKNWSKPYLLVDTTLDYSKEVCQGFQEYYEGELGGEVAGESQFQNGDTSISTQISDIQASGADSIVLCTYNPGGATAVRNIRAAGLDLPIISGESLSGTSWLEAVPDLSDFYAVVYGCLYGDDPDPKVNDFRDAYEAAYGEDPADAATSVITGYALAEVVVAAIEQANGKTDGASLAAVMDKMTDFPSLLPTTYTSDVHINVGRPARMLDYENGEVSCVPDTFEASKDVNLHLS